MSPMNYIYLATILFAIGGSTVLLRRNAIVVFMGVELMLNAASLAFVTFARMHGSLEGQVIAMFVMVVAAARSSSGWPSSWPSSVPAGRPPSTTPTC